MTIRDLIDLKLFEVINEGENLSRNITKPYCCDLLSVAMSSAPEGCAWCTVMANLNTLAVSTLTETACVILAQNARLDEAALKKAAEEGITVFGTDLPAFDAAVLIYEKLKEV